MQHNKDPCSLLDGMFSFVFLSESPRRARPNRDHNAQALSGVFDNPPMMKNFIFAIEVRWVTVA